jgi:hypothetical protein
MATTGNNNPSSTPSTTPDLSFAQKLAKEATIDWTTLSRAIQDAYNYSVEINNTFGQGKERLSEMMGAVSDAIPKITRLGGSVKDVQESISGIAEASKRNVIANTEDVAKLYAATQLIEGSADSLSNSFLDIGVGIGQIGTQLESSINYIRSIGGNTKTVMKDVTENMGQMNRFQFEGGVAGLTKMAAQASMLRFDMKQTFQLANDVLDPERAIDVAAAFQRLGVSAGDLADPFQLMNQSINDPSGLQNSLADVAKQFTYFDDKTKTFKINPQGVLTLREMEKQTGVSAAEMSKMGLAAAEMDQRLSAVNLAGLSFVNEEDKQYLSNIANMEGGTYKVTLEDGTKKELSDLKQDEFNKLLEQQKTGPKTLEDMARDQLGIDKLILSDVAAIREAVAQGITSPKQIRKGIATTERVTKKTLGAVSGSIDTKDIRDVSEGFLDALGGVVRDFKDGNKSNTDVLSTGLNRFADTLDASQKNFVEILKEIGVKMSSTKGNQTGVENIISSKSEEISKYYANPTSSAPISSLITNKAGVLQNTQNNSIAQTTNSKVDVGGKIEIEVKAPAGVSGDQLKQMMDSTINSIAFKDYIVRTASPSNPTKEPVSKTYSA